LRDQYIQRRREEEKKRIQKAAARKRREPGEEVEVVEVTVEVPWRLMIVRE
jgi:hypothetical protein